eukprot:gene5266-biopygen4507
MVGAAGKGTNGRGDSGVAGAVRPPRPGADAAASHRRGADGAPPAAALRPAAARGGMNDDVAMAGGARSARASGKAMRTEVAAAVLYGCRGMSRSPSGGRARRLCGGSTRAAARWRRCGGGTAPGRREPPRRGGRSDDGDGGCGQGCDHIPATLLWRPHGRFAK